MSNTILADIFIIFAVSVPAAFLFHKIKLPPIIGFLAAGLLIGPSGLGLVADTSRINLFAEIGVALLVFSLGLEFSLKHFKEIKAITCLGGTLQISATIALATLVSALVGLSLKEGVFIGCAISLSSTAIVYYILSQKRLVDSPHGRITAGILVFQDVSAIFMVALLPIIAAPHLDVSWPSVAGSLGRAAFVIAIFFVGKKYALTHILHQITLTRSKELFLATILIVSFGFSYFTHAMGLSFALGAFLSGLMIADTDFRFHALSEIAPFRHCFNSLFFVSIGMLANPAFLASKWWLPIVIILGVPLGKAVIAAAVVSLFKYPPNISLMTGMAISQVGEFSFIIAALAKKSGLVEANVYDFIVTVSFFTILITPLFIALSPSVVRICEKIMPPFLRNYARRGVSIKTDHLKDHVIICGFGPLGSSVGRILEQAEKDYIVLELNPATVRKLKQLDENRPVYLGDGASSDILYKSGVERASVLAVTAPDYMNSIAIIKQARALNPDIKIITRAKFRNQVSDLYSAGADIVVSEELEAGIEMGKYILLHIGIDETSIEQYVQTIRAFGSADFF